MGSTIIDNAAIFFKPTLEQVYDFLDDPTVRDPNLERRDFITVAPTDTISQTSNSAEDMNFGTDYTAYLVDRCGTVLMEITNKVTITQFTHSVTGIRNIRITLGNIGKSFYVPVHIKLVPEDGIYSQRNEGSFFSSPFHINDNIDGTTMLHYRGYGVLDGVDYGVIDDYNNIRMRFHFRNAGNDTAVQTYTQYGGTRVESRSDVSMPQKFIAEYFDNHGFRALSYILQSDVIWAAKGRRTIGERMTAAGNPEMGDILGTSNFAIGNLTAYIDRSQTFDPRAQVRVPFALVQARPSGSYTAASIAGVPIEYYFNRNITVNTGSVTVYDASDDSVVATYTQADLVTVGANGVRITDFIGSLTDVGEYYHTFTAGLFTSPTGETTTARTDFSIGASGDWLDGDWLTGDFFTG